MSRKTIEVETVAEAYLALLADRGVEYLFANAGTDFAPLIEAMAAAQAKGAPCPIPMITTHETVVMAMAHGYAMVSGKVPATMMHVSVGTANALCGAFNAARENVPLLFTAGRSPVTEEGLPGSRDNYIHWAQEMFDQAGMVREIVKWEYELRNAEQLETVVDRALGIAVSEPKGPVYLSLPRETLAQPLGHFTYESPSRHRAPSPARADAAAIEEAGRLLATAESPLIITATAGRDPAAVGPLGAFAGACGIPVVQFRPRYLSLPTDHPTGLGFDSTPHLAEADVILVLECDVPWMPALAAPRPECKIIHLGLDPLFQRIPIRGFTADLAITGQAATALPELQAAVLRHLDGARVESRLAGVAKKRAAYLARTAKLRDSSAALTPIHPAWVSRCLDRAKPANTIAISEYALMLDHYGATEPGSFFGPTSASGLGWGMGAALGAKLAAPDRMAVAVLGDGAYIFGNPVAAHHASALHDLPVLFIVVNNAMWGAVRKAALTMYPEGRTAKSNQAPFIHLDKLPAFEQICAAAGGYGERVEDPAALPGALERAIHAVQVEGRQALLNVICRAI